MISEELEQLPVETPEQTYVEKSLAEIAKPKPMREEEYAALLEVEEQPPVYENRIEKGDVRFAAYLGFLRACPSRAMAANAAGLLKSQLDRHRKRFPEFEVTEKEVMADAKDVLFGAAYQRAVHGVLKPVYQLGKLVGYEREYSDKLMELLLRGMHKEMFQEEKKENGPTTVVLASPEQIAAVLSKVKLFAKDEPKTIEAHEIPKDTQ
jgi:hypothetical protein